jgi:hypothetical protein
MGSFEVQKFAEGSELRMTAYEIVLFLIVALLGITLVVLGVASIARKWVNKARWDKTKGIRGPVAVILGAGLVALASALLIHRFPDSASEAVTAIGTVSGDVITALIAATTLYAVTLLHRSVGEQKKAVHAQRRAVEEQTKQLKITAIQNVNAEMLKIDRWMADHPKYIDAIKRPKHEKPDHGAAVAEVYADFIAQVVDHSDYLPDGHSEPWENYFKEVIREWPQLEKFMTDHPSWYGNTMKKLLPEREMARPDASSEPSAVDGEGRPKVAG